MWPWEIVLAVGIGGLLFATGRIARHWRAQPGWRPIPLQEQSAACHRLLTVYYDGGRLTLHPTSTKRSLQFVRYAAGAYLNCFDIALHLAPSDFSGFLQRVNAQGFRVRDDRRNLGGSVKVHVEGDTEAVVRRMLELAAIAAEVLGHDGAARYRARFSGVGETD